MKIEEMKVGELIPYENNPRKNDAAVDAVAASIREFGFKVPIVIDKAGVIIAGHTRAKAAKKLGMKTVPVIRADDLTEEQVKAFRLADNKTGELAEWDFAKLEEELRALDDIDMGQFGFEEKEEDLEERVKRVTAKLTDKFVVPPFSVLDRRAGYWAKRRQEWNELGIKSKEGRDENLMNAGPRTDWYDGQYETMVQSTSIFDPVLCEVVYRWFSPEGGQYSTRSRADLFEASLRKSSADITLGSTCGLSRSRRTKSRPGAQESSRAGLWTTARTPTSTSRTAPKIWFSPVHHMLT